LKEKQPPHNKTNFEALAASLMTSYFEYHAGTIAKKLQQFFKNCILWNTNHFPYNQANLK